ncbi:hypothetical protein [Dictyobacter alpinus]|nr:hypothetical protein [Dictyobacter alpinus]
MSEPDLVEDAVDETVGATEAGVSARRRRSLFARLVGSCLVTPAEMTC